MAQNYNFNMSYNTLWNSIQGEDSVFFTDSYDKGRHVILRRSDYNTQQEIEDDADISAGYMDGILRYSRFINSGVSTSYK